MNLRLPIFATGWYVLLDRLIHEGQMTSPRGRPVREIQNVTLTVRNALHNVLVCKDRKPSYRFMVAEWLWIWFGHDDVASIAPFNPNIAQFSDDGVTFAGAYGPHILKQWAYVRDLLRDDPSTRQAVVLIYQQPSQPSKDVPCTLSLQFLIRNESLHTTVYMRSSDIWLGLVYDFFNFSMLANIMAAELNQKVGSITFHLGSSHLYESDRLKAEIVLEHGDLFSMRSPVLTERPPMWLNELISTAATGGSCDVKPIAPWFDYFRVLTSTDNETALKHMPKVI